jgi:hypothetical protein
MRSRRDTTTVAAPAWCRSEITQIVRVPHPVGIARLDGEDEPNGRTKLDTVERVQQPAGSKSSSREAVGARSGMWGAKMIVTSPVAPICRQNRVFAPRTTVAPRTHPARHQLFSHAAGSGMSKRSRAFTCLPLPLPA